jgi:hypothetical protein
MPAWSDSKIKLTLLMQGALAVSVSGAALLQVELPTANWQLPRVEIMGQVHGGPRRSGSPDLSFLSLGL